MRIENISEGKVIGIGAVTVLPGETKEIPESFERSPVLEVYKRMGLVRITGRPSASKEAGEEDAALREAEALAAEKRAREEAEALRQARLASLNGISEEDLGRLASELGINPADCKDQADVLKKVKAALKKG